MAASLYMAKKKKMNGVITRCNWCTVAWNSRLKPSDFIELRERCCEQQPHHNLQTWEQAKLGWKQRALKIQDSDKFDPTCIKKNGGGFAAKYTTHTPKWVRARIADKRVQECHWILQFLLRSRDLPCQSENTVVADDSIGRRRQDLVQYVFLLTHARAHTSPNDTSTSKRW